MPDETAKFVQLVKTYPCLYNSTLPEYTQKDVTDKAWSDIAHQMKWLAPDCKEKWRSIRNAFVRSLKPYPNATSSKAKKPYYLRELMEFVLPYINPLPHSENTGNIILLDSNMHHSEKVDPLQNSDDKNSFVALETLKRNQDTPSSIEEKKRKTSFNEKDEMDQSNQESKDKKTPTDSSKMFLLSLLPDIKSLSDKRVREFKILTMLLLEELLTEQEKEIGNDSCFRRPLPPHCSSSQVSTSAPSTTDFSNTQNKGKVTDNILIVPATVESTTPERAGQTISHQQRVPSLWGNVLCYYPNTNKI